MKPVILFDLPGRIVEIGGLVQNIDLPPQHIARLRRQIARRQHAGMPFDAKAQIVDLVDVPDFELAHEEAAPRARHQQPLLSSSRAASRTGARLTPSSRAIPASTTFEPGGSRP